MKLKAAYHYKNLGRYDEAIRFLLASDRAHEAVKIGSEEGVRHMDSGDTDSVASIIQAFPEELIQGDPYLMFLRGAALMSSEFELSYSYLHGALISFSQKGNLVLLMKTVGLMISICYQKNDLNNIKSVVAHIPKFKAIAKSKYARITLLLSAFMNTAWADKLPLAGKLYKVIERFNFYEPLWDYTFKMAKVMILYRKGDLETAKELIPQLMHHPTALVNDRWKSIGLAVSHAVTSQMGDIEASQKLMEELLSIGEKYSSDYALSYGLRLTAYIRYQNRDIKGAVLQMDSSIHACARYGNSILASVEKITKYFWESEYMPVQPLLEKSLEELCRLAELKPGQGFLEYCEVITGALYKKASIYTEAERYLLKAYKTSDSKKAYQSICGVVMHLAELYYRKKDFKLEDKYLKFWGKTTADSNYVYFREMDYTTLVWICARCIEKNIYPEHMRKIISKYFGVDSAVQMAQNPKAVADNPNLFVSNTSKAQQASKNIRVKMFGSFKLTVDDMEIGENEWKTRKICSILKYILANPEKTISREALATMLWPESNAKSASTSLRAALYELRKTLGRFGMAFETAEALITEDNHGFHICNNHMIETDSDRFSKLYRKYKSEKSTSEETNSILSEMLGLYEGDFLGNDTYDEWIDVTREHYRSIFIEVSHKLAEHYIADGDSEKAEALLVKHMKIDPFDENACGMLIQLLQNTGQNNRAASLRRQFEKRFETEMGIKPNLAIS